MKKIPLTQGYFALVDDDKYKVLMQYSWHAVVFGDNVYAATKITGGNNEFMHWYVAGQPLPGYVSDHINRNSLDQRLENIRHVTTRQNLTNRRNKSSPYLPGISFEENSNKWKAYIRLNGNLKNLGRYKDPIKAFCAYRSAVISIGEELLPEYEEKYKAFKMLNLT